MQIWPGRSDPLGATFDGAGTNFALFSRVAESVELCLFDRNGSERRVTLPEVTGHVWHGYLPSVRPGQRYGFRVHGPHDPSVGELCNPARLLLDPYARAIDGEVHWDEAVYDAAEGEAPDGRDSAPFVPRSIVVDGGYDWGDDRAPRTSWQETVIYELHVRGFTAGHPDVPPADRGTYRGLAHPSVTGYLRDLGVTAVELMPVHHFVHDHFLVDKGLRNYWGYNSIGFFAPHADYSAAGGGGDQVREFRDMVRALHDVGLEVILDVVYNHTAEGGRNGPVLSFRGLDNAAYYRLSPDDPRDYVDYSGCGNSLNMREPFVLRLVMDSLRYWIEEMHVDGFRFDLAPALARELHDVDRLSAFFDIIHQDPVLRRTKLIAEPWDVGEGGYQVGNFPPGWSEWNGKYRDTVRDFWRGQDSTLAEFACRATGSADLYESTGRRPFASVNFVTCHDGFTLRDMVSYERRHNEANGEDGRDGESDNRSWNCGAEGETDDQAVRALRSRQQRNFLATLLLSQGVPMLLAGDEQGRTQGGNNNPYCQDNEISWLDWESGDADLLMFVQRLLELRGRHPVLRRPHWFRGRPVHGSKLDDIAWFKPDGVVMGDEDWAVGYAKSLGVFLNGKGLAGVDGRGRRIVDDHFYIMLNAHDEELDFRLPAALRRRRWREVLDTAQDGVDAVDVSGGNARRLAARSLVLLQHQRRGSSRKA